MKFIKVIGTGALALSAYDWASAAHPPLDRPTPPPACADGICYPNPETYGWYATRWRRWPTEDLQPVPTVPEPIKKLAPDVSPYETPPAEEEDRRAPAPTKPTLEAPDESGDTPATTPLTPPSGGGGLDTSPMPPPSGPAAAPPSVAPPSRPPSGAPATPPVRMPWENGGEPTGDLDPPPSLPISVSAASARIPGRMSPARLESARPQQQPASRTQNSPSSDPPPSLPMSLASMSY